MFGAETFLLSQVGPQEGPVRLFVENGIFFRTEFIGMVKRLAQEMRSSTQGLDWPIISTSLIEHGPVMRETSLKTPGDS